MSKKQWFNCNTVDEGNKFKPPSKVIGDPRSVCHMNLGKHFYISMSTDNKFEAVFCQIGENGYKFISPKSGNRIIDDNREIKTIQLVEDIKPVNSDVRDPKGVFEAMITDINMIIRLNIAIDMQTPQLLEGNIKAIAEAQRMKSEIKDYTECAYSHFLKLIKDNTEVCPEFK